MTRGGSREGAGRRTLSEFAKRKQLSCRVKDSTLHWLSDTKASAGKSVGELVDLAVELLQKHSEELELVKE